MPDRRGFTLVELLVVIGIIAVLISILLPAVNRARQQAARVKASSDCRQLLAAYAEYVSENKGRLPFGYPPDYVNRAAITAELRDGTIVNFPVANRYPWRLIRYVGNIWDILYPHVAAPTLDSGEVDSYRRSLYPGFGLNTFFLGGQNGFGLGFLEDGNMPNGAKNFKPNVGKHVVFKATDVKPSSGIIVFTESRLSPLASMAPDDDVTRYGDGRYYVQPPVGNAGGAKKRWWEVSADGNSIVRLTKVDGGLPNTRFGKGGTIVGFFDGHVSSLRPRELDDMRLWCPRATKATYDFATDP